MSEALLEVTDLVKHFPIKDGIIIDRQVGAVQAVDGVSFPLHPGETPKKSYVEECFDGEPRQKGIGTCKAGERKCTSEGIWSGCEGQVLPAATDLCDNLDEDCDGSVDENLGSTTCGKGICEITVENCIAGESQECAAEGECEGAAEDHTHD